MNARGAGHRPVPQAKGLRALRARAEDCLREAGWTQERIDDYQPCAESDPRLDARIGTAGAAALVAEAHEGDGLARYRLRRYLAGLLMLRQPIPAKVADYLAQALLSGDLHRAFAIDWHAGGARVEHLRRSGHVTRVVAFLLALGRPLPQALTQAAALTGYSSAKSLRQAMLVRPEWLARPPAVDLVNTSLAALDAVRYFLAQDATY